MPERWALLGTRMTGSSGSPKGVTPISVTPQACTPDTLRRVLAGTPFFESLDAREIDAIAGSFRETHYDMGHVIQHAGDPAERLSIVAAGMVRLVRPTPDGQDVLLEIRHPGDFFGSLAMLGDTVFAEDVTAHTFCCILHASAEDFRRLLERYPSAAMATLSFVAGRLRDAHETIEQLSARPVEQRIARTLVKLVNRTGRRRGVDVLIDMPLSRQDLADMTGTTVETASRVVSELRRDGVVASGRGWIAVSDMAALQRIADA